MISLTSITWLYLVLTVSGNAHAQGKLARGVGRGVVILCTVTVTLTYMETLTRVV